MGLGLAFLRQGLKALHGGLQAQGLMGPGVVVEAPVLGELGPHFVQDQSAGASETTSRGRRADDGGLKARSTSFALSSTMPEENP